MYNTVVSFLGCSVLSFSYVSSLYIWSSKTNRNLPETIKKRFLSCFFNMLLGPVVVYVILKLTNNDIDLFVMLGLRYEGLLQALLLPLLLTAVLFLGPIFVLFVDFESEIGEDKEFDLIWWRNHVVGPLSEEFIFRSCMLVILLISFTPTNCIVLSSLFFGSAHLHHIYSNIYEGHSLKQSVLIVSFQFIYTSLFGAYSAFLFLRTGHFVAPFLAHAFCNFMGFPNFQKVFTLGEPRKSLGCLFYVLGLVGWGLLLVPATNPYLYSNNLHWKINSTSS